MRIISLILLMVVVLKAMLVPTPFIQDPEPIQRFGIDKALQYLGKRTIGRCYGIGFVKPRGMNSIVMVVSDDAWHRLLYINIKDGVPQVLRAYGGEGSGAGEFYSPRGIFIDTTVYEGNPDNYWI